MMSDKMIENNQVSIVGEVVSDFSFSHEVFGEGFYMLDVSVKRLSDSCDVIPLMISERLVNVNEDCRGACIRAAASSVPTTAMRKRKTGWCCRCLSGNWNLWTRSQKTPIQTRSSWTGISVKRRCTEKLLWEGKSRIFCWRLTGLMENPTIFPVSVGGGTQGLLPVLR